MDSEASIKRTRAVSRREALRRSAAAALLVGVPRQYYVESAQDFPAEEVLRLMRLANVPGLSCARVSGDRIEVHALGERRAGENPTTSDTVFAAASLSKTVFAYAFLGLVAEGAIDVDRPVADYVPLPNPEDARSRAITARHLLSHSGGWRNWRNTAATPLSSDFEPGSRWSYSGEGFYFLQRAVEKVTGMGIGAVVRRRVFAPLGMSKSAMVVLPEFDAHAAVGHNFRGEPAPSFGLPLQQELRRAMAARGLSVEEAKVEDVERALSVSEPQRPVLPNFMSPNAAASMVTTAADFALFLRHLVTASARRDPAAALVERMITPQVRINESIHWGLGAGLEEPEGNERGRSLWQWGDNPGFKHFFFAWPGDQSAVVVFTNGDRGARVYERVIRRLTGRDHAAFLAV